MLEFFRSLRRGPGDHRDVFAEFAVKLVFLVAAADGGAEAAGEIEGGAMSGEFVHGPSPAPPQARGAPSPREGRG